MSRRAAGVTFCAIAAFLFGLRYIVATQLIGALRPSEYDPTSVVSLYASYVGTPLVTTSLVALIAGVVYLVLAEIDDLRRHDH